MLSSVACKNGKKLCKQGLRLGRGNTPEPFQNDYYKSALHGTISKHAPDGS